MAVYYYVEVRNRIARLTKKEGHPVGGNKGDTVVFDFDSEWESSQDKVALFIWGGKYFPVEFVGNECEVPPIDNSNNFRLGVYVGETIDSPSYIASTVIDIPCDVSVRDYAISAHPEVGKNYTYEAKGYAKQAQEAAERAESVANLSEGAEIAIMAVKSKGFYSLMEALHRDNATFIPWRNYPYEELYEVWEDDYEYFVPECFFAYVFPHWDDAQLGERIKSNIVFPPTITCIPPMFVTWGGDRQPLRIDNIWIPPTVTVIKSGAFDSCYGSFTIPTSVKRIETRAFTMSAEWVSGEYDIRIIDLTEFITEPFPTIDGGNALGGSCIVKVIKGRKAELEAMTNWAEAYIEEV